MKTYICLIALIILFTLNSLASDLDSSQSPNLSTSQIYNLSTNQDSGLSSENKSLLKKEMPNELICISDNGVQYSATGHLTLLKCTLQKDISYDAIWDIEGNIYYTNGKSAYNITLPFRFEKNSSVRINVSAENMTYNYLLNLVIVEGSSENLKKISAENALWFVHSMQKRYSFGNEIYGYWSHDYLGKWAVGYTSFALLAYNSAGYNLEDNHPYSEDMKRALNFILASCNYQLIGEQFRGNPDSNNNSIGIYCMHLKSHTNYEAGLSLAAISAINKPDYISTAGGPFINNRRLKDISQDMIDWLVWAQNENIARSGGQGSWYYTENGNEGDMSVSQWPIFGIIIAESNLNLSSPDWIKEESRIWLERVQGSDGSFSYRGRGKGDTGNIALTGSGLTVLSYLGIDKFSEMIEKAKSYIAKNWLKNKPERRQDNLGNFYSMNNVMRASVLYNISHYDDIDWEKHYIDWLINNQKEDGSWNDESWLKLHISPNLAASLGIMVINNDEVYRLMKSIDE